MSAPNVKKDGDGSADPAHPASEDDSCDDCLTERVADDVLKCLMKRPWCNYAFLFGFSAFCTHLWHKEFRKKNKGQ